jgi:hypothetical protein
VKIFVLLFASFVLGGIACACNGVQTQTYQAPDLGDSGCSPQPTIQCEVVAASSTSCTGDPNATGEGALLPFDASFPAGCQAYFRSADCSSRGNCTCDGQDEAGAAASWNCHDNTSPDAGP